MRTLSFALTAVALAGMFLVATGFDIHSAAVALPTLDLDLSHGLVVAGLMIAATNLRGTTALNDPLIMMAPKSIEDLQVERQELLDASQGIVAAADEAGADIADEDLGKIEANKTKIDAIDRQIKIRQGLAEAAAPTQGQGRRTAAEQTPAGGKAGAGDRRVSATPRDNTKFGFRSFGTFAQSVKDHSRRIENDETRKLMATQSTYGNEGTGTDGGFLVPPSFSSEIWQKVQAEENLLNRCTPLVTDGNSMMIPKDETTPWQTSGGVQVYWEGEAQAPSASKPSFEMGALRLSKLMALVPISEELLSDASGLESWLRAKAPGKMAAKLNTAIIAGTGVGQPLGIIPSYTAVGASVVSVAKETSQPADTVWFANINKMWARMYAPWRRNAVWLVNQDVEPQLEAMAFAPTGVTPTAASGPVYLPPGGLADAPYGRLKGRPVVAIEACAAIGDLGDIILTDLSQYWALTKSGGIQTDTSIHLYFDQALTAFRFIFRVNGQPAWSAPITRQNGSNTLSWAVTLDAR